MPSHLDRSSSMEQGLLRTTDEEKLTQDTTQGYTQHQDDDSRPDIRQPHTQKMASSKRLILALLVGLVVVMGFANARPCMDAIQTGSLRVKSTLERRQAPPNGSNPIGQPGQEGQGGQTGTSPGGQPPNENPPGQAQPTDGPNPPGQGTNPGQGVTSTSTVLSTEIVTVTSTPSSSSPVDTPTTSSSTPTSTTPSTSSTPSSTSTPSSSSVSAPSSTSTSSPPPETSSSEPEPEPTDIPISTRKTITIGHITTSSAVATTTFTSTRPDGGVTTVTSVSWVQIVPTSADSAEDPELQSAASGGRVGVALAAAGSALLGALLLV